ncbi:MAG: hypothetical protein IKT38_03515 [Clostridia bacterium]|nr:hypothetical protein [Clostridia bacterium]
MSKNPWSFELPDSFFETQKFLKSISSSLETLNKINQTFSVSQNLSGAYAAVASYQSILNNVYSNSAFENLAKSATIMQSVLANIQIPTVIDMIPTMERILPIIDTSWKIPTIDWDWMAKTLENYDYEPADVEDVLTDEIRAELKESAEEALLAKDSQKNIEQRYGEWKEKHPLLADIYLLIIGAILGFLLGFMQAPSSATTTKNSNVYELPSSTSNIVVNINVDQDITVINEVPYYYEVVYIDPEIGEEKKGYIYKPNVAIQEVETDDMEPSNSESQ